MKTKVDYNTWSIYQLLGLSYRSRSFEVATILANKLTKAHNQYFTAIKKNDGSWYASSKYNPIIWK